MACFDPAIDAIHAALDHLEATSPSPIKYRNADVVAKTVEEAANVAQPAEAGSCKAQITAIYQQHAPERVADVDAMLQKYEGREQKLLAKVLRRYCPSVQESEEQRQRAAKKKEEFDKYAKSMMLKYTIFRQNAPDRWRFAYFGDEARNQQYDAAIRAAVSDRGGSACTVVDVGVGSGLLAMMAARSGATVLTTDAHKPMSNVVSKIVAANGFGKDQLRAVWATGDNLWCPATSTKERDTDSVTIDARASVVTTEIVTPLLLSDSLSSFVWLGQCKELTTEDVRLVPRSAQMWIMPIECPIQPQSLEKPLRSNMSGLNLAEFDKFRRHQLQPVSLKHVKYTPLAAPQLLSDFDFATALKSGTFPLQFRASQVGTWHGIAMWHEISLGADQSISCEPTDSSNALQSVVFLPDPMEMQLDDPIVFTVSHDTKKWRFEWPMPIPRFPEVESTEVLRWHWAMLMDEERNRPYDLAISKAVAKASYVLDIGSGTGLLSMFAARAGAKHITTVEGSHQMADCAARCIAANDMGEAIHPLIMMSTDIVVGEHMAQKADLCISEIVDCGLLGEWCLPTMCDAKDRLLTEGAAVIPCGATVHAFLLQMPRQPYSVSRPLEQEAGFDMKEYNTYAYGPETYEQCRLSDVEYTRLSDQFDAWTFDLTGKTKYAEEAKTLQITATADGTLDAVCFYFTLNLDEEISICTAPEIENCWTQSITFFKTPLQVKQGDVITIPTYHKIKRIAWAQPALSTK